MTWHDGVCEWCGEEFQYRVNPSHPSRRFCSRSCAQSFNRRETETSKRQAVGWQRPTIRADEALTNWPFTDEAPAHAMGWVGEIGECRFIPFVEVDPSREGARRTYGHGDVVAWEVALDLAVQKWAMEHETAVRRARTDMTAVWIRGRRLVLASRRWAA